MAALAQNSAFSEAPPSYHEIEKHCVKEYTMIKKLEVGDDVTQKIVDSYNAIKESPRRIYHHGRPSVGDKVVWMRQCMQFVPGAKFRHSYPLEGALGREVSAILYISPEHPQDRDVFVDLTAGGQGCKHFVTVIISNDSGSGNPNDPYTAIAFGKTETILVS